MLAAPATLSAQNQLSNGSFSGNTTGWTTATGNWTISSVTAPSGLANYSTAVQASITVGAAGAADGWIAQSKNITSGSERRYFARAWVRSELVNNAYVQIKRFDGAGVEILPRIDSPLNVNTLTWEPLEVSVDTTTATARLEILLRFKRPTGSAGKKAWFTGAELRLAPTLALEPTFENIGAFIGSPGISSDEVAANLEYRVSGQPVWLLALAPDCYQLDNEFRGSVLQLQPNTSYDVRASLRLANGEIVNRRQESVTTWSESYPTIGSGRDITLPASYTSGTYTISGVHGSATSWYRYKAAAGGSTVDAPVGTNGPAVRIENCSYVIFEGVRVRGGKENGIEVVHSNNIRIRNCDIAEWLRWSPVSFGQHSGATHGYKYGSNPAGTSGTWINICGGIKLASYGSGDPYQLTGGVGSVTHSIVIENNLIHHPTLSSPNWLHGHPTGPDGIELWYVGGQNVIRNNDIVAGAGKFFNDGITSLPNTGTVSTTALAGNGNRNSDIHGNLFLSLNDDGAEIDGDLKNVRIWHNWMETGFTGFSASPNVKGPAYIFRNTFVIGDEVGRTNVGVKLGGGAGFTHILHNSALVRTGAFNTKTDMAGATFTRTRNNLYGSVPERQGGRFSNVYPVTLPALDAASDVDFDLIPEWAFSGTPLPGVEANAVVGSPTFVSYADRDLRLTSLSPGYQDAFVLPQISGSGTPHIGSIADAAAWSALPPRPSGAASIVPNRSHLRIRVGQTASFTLSLVSDTQSWTAQGGEPWLGVFPASGAASGSAQALSCTVNATGLAPGRQLTFVSVRTANGLLRTVPVDLEVEPAQPASSFVFESESVIPDADFQSVGDPSASGGAYARVVTSSNVIPADSTALTLSFTVPATAGYYVHVRARAAGPYASAVTGQQSAWLKIDSTLYKEAADTASDEIGRWTFPGIGSADRRSWTWHTAHRVQTYQGTTKDGGPFVLTAGAHTIRVYRRAADVHFDQFVVSTSPIPPVGFQMASNQVVIEAENCSTRRDAGGARWDIVTASGAAGGNVNNAVQSLPNANLNLTPHLLNTPRAEYTIHLPANSSTTYYVHVRGKEGANDTGQSDSASFSIDNNVSTYAVVNFLPATLGWVTSPTQLTVPLSTSPSIRTLTMWMREDGAIIDRIVLSTSPTPPSGTQPAESTRL